MTGAVVRPRIPAWTRETELRRSLYSDLTPGDMVMADQLHGNYADLALMQQPGCDGLLRAQQARKTDFRNGKQHGIGDHQGEWRKPTWCPKPMSKSPEMLRKELWAHLRAYNLLRSVMAQAAPQANFQRERLSLQGGT
jgi:hypothetical protein